MSFNRTTLYFVLLVAFCSVIFPSFLDFRWPYRIYTQDLYIEWYIYRVIYRIDCIERELLSLLRLSNSPIVLLFMRHRNFSPCTSNNNHIYIPVKKYGRPSSLDFRVVYKMSFFLNVESFALFIAVNIFRSCGDTYGSLAETPFKRIFSFDGANNPSFLYSFAATRENSPRSLTKHIK